MQAVIESTLQAVHTTLAKKPVLLPCCLCVGESERCIVFDIPRDEATIDDGTLVKFRTKQLGAKYPTDSTNRAVPGRDLFNLTETVWTSNS